MRRKKEAAGGCAPGPAAETNGDCQHCSRLLQRQQARTRAIAMIDQLPLLDQLAAYKAIALTACEAVRTLTARLAALEADRIEGANLL